MASHLLFEDMIFSFVQVTEETSNNTVPYQLLSCKTFKWLYLYWHKYRYWQELILIKGKQFRTVYLISTEFTKCYTFQNYQDEHCYGIASRIPLIKVQAKYEYSGNKTIHNQTKMVYILG